MASANLLNMIAQGGPDIGGAIRQRELQQQNLLNSQAALKNQTAQIANTQANTQLLRDKMVQDQSQAAMQRNAASGLYALLALSNAKDEEKPALWGQIAPSLKAQDPQFFASIPNQYDAGQIHALAGQFLGNAPQTLAAPILERLQPKIAPKGVQVIGNKAVNLDTGEVVYEGEEKPVVVGRTLVVPSTGQVLYTAPADASGGASPYVQFLPTSEGYMVGNARTGAVSPVTVDGRSVMPASIDPATQGAIAAAKAEGTGTGEGRAARAKRAEGAPALLEIISEAKQILPGATGSAAGAVRDAAGRAVGISTKGAQANAKLQVLSGNLTLAQPRMEGPQSNADAILYQQMAADVGNPQKTTEERMAALEQLEKLQRKYAAGATTAPTSGGFKVIRKK